MSVKHALALVVGLALCVGAAATERKAYKIVDEKGNVSYSQTPPTQGKEAKKVDISPANSSRGGYAGDGDAYRSQQSYTYTDPNSQAYQKQQQEAEQKRREALKAECNRNRGTDCDNPETLRLMESQKIPGGRYYR